MKDDGEVVVIYKKLGETPLEALTRLRRKRKYGDANMTYAGRLDPMAEGALLVLTGEKCKEKMRYLNIFKTYEFGVLFDFETDSLDLLGLVTEIGTRKLSPSTAKLKRVARELTGQHALPYPSYSSKTVDGTPLWLLERRGNLDKKAIPKRVMDVKKINFLGIREINRVVLLRQITARIKKVRGDFRQDDILRKWNFVLGKQSRHDAAGTSEQKYKIAKFEMKCGGGTYVRSIVKKMGEDLKLPTVAFSIKRTEFRGSDQ